MAVVLYTFTQKRYTEQHNETEYVYYLARFEGFVGLLMQSKLYRLKCVDILERLFCCEDGGGMSDAVCTVLDS